MIPHTNMRALGWLTSAWLIACSNAKGKEPKPLPLVNSANTTSTASPASAEVRTAAPADASASNEGVSSDADNRVPALPPLAEASVKELLAHWLDAQNRADFAAYSRLYAQGFSALEDGSRWPRQAWLDARATLFKAPRTVAAKKLSLATTPHMARVRLLQTRRALTESEVRIKEFWIVPSAEGPRIAYEQTLASELPDATASARGRAAFWLADEGGVFIQRAAPAHWSRGEPRRAGSTVAVRDVDRGALPPAVRTWLGRAVRVFGPAGVVCESRVLAFELRAEISVPPELRSWQNEKPGPGASAGQAGARDIWQLAGEDGRMLVGKFATPCQGAIWAGDAADPTPEVAAPEPADSDLGNALLDAFRELPAYRELQQRFAQRMPPGSAQRWEDVDGRRSVLALRLANHAPLGFVSVEAGSGCATFNAGLSAVWEVTARTTDHPELRLLAVLDSNDALRLAPASAFDLDGDGAPEILLGPDGLSRVRSLMRKTPVGYARELLRSVPFFGAPC